MSKHAKSKTGGRRCAWLTTRERKRSTEQMNEGECSLSKIEININGPVNALVLHADSIIHERREL